LYSNLFHISPVEMIGAGGLIIMGRKNTIQVFFSMISRCQKPGYLKNTPEGPWRISCGLC
jgi:hypothetical protein